MNSSVKTFEMPDVVVRARAKVGESPVWDRRSGRLCWVDIENGQLFENDLTSTRQISWSFDTLLGAIAPRAHEEGFAVAVAEGLGVCIDGALTVEDPVLPEPERRMNDAKCDSRGRLWAGSTHLKFTPGVGTLHRWDGHGPSTAMVTGFSLPNGLGWDAEDTVMYLVDSMNHQLLRAPYDGDSGTVGAFTELCKVLDGLPDGLAVDVEGCIWLAVWGGYAIQRYDPTGRLVGKVPMPVEKPSSCAFGDDGTLYITSASADIPDAQLAEQPLAGSVFALASGTQGVPVAAFAG